MRALPRIIPPAPGTRPALTLRALPTILFHARTSLFVSLAVALAATAASAGTPATTADDICASNANPCNVTRSYDVTANAVLDFGLRSVNVTGTGEFNFGSGSGRIECGAFSATTLGAFLTAVGPAPGGGTGSGSVLLLARRRCSVASPVVPCLDGSDCELGPCGVRRCSGKSTRTCLADADCKIGICSALKRCSGSTTFTRCATNADCDFGSCPAQLTCSGRGDNPVSCASNSDCSFGTCSVGAASITMDGPVLGSSDSPATLVFRAADSVTISKPVTLNGMLLESDGGSLAVDARTGSITVTGKISATGNGGSQGGSVELNAGTDISIQNDITVVGGDFDGGSVDLASGRDITIGSSLLANSVSGAGFGGEITIAAGRDLSVSGVTAANRSTLETDGHTDIEGSAGDGGSQEITAERYLNFNANTLLTGNGSAPDGSGADMSLEAGAGLVMDGDIYAKSVGSEGGGGFVFLATDYGTASVGATALFDASGGNSGGGTLQVDSDSGDLSFAGDGDVSGGASGTGGNASLSARQSADMNGSLVVSGMTGGQLDVDACRVTLAAGASLANNGNGGSNAVVAHDTMSLLSGSSLTTAPGGTNSLRYKYPAKPPLVQGTVSPAPVLTVDPSLSDCPLCGNRAIDAGESCDDGNAIGGDGCSASCQNERCLTQTIAPGFPAVALCEDGDVCTTDVCNTALAGGTCQHPAKNCDDAVACTIDACNGDDGTCRHTASDSVCNDGNACTDDFCSLTMGCSNTANSSPCDDNNRCTGNDVCSNKACHGTRIGGCLFCGDEFVNFLSGEQCDDGNNASGDCCSPTCRYESSNSPCEDGQFCTVDDKCNATGTCLTGVPNTCVDADPCTADSCSEDMAVCVNAQTPRDASTCLAAPSTRLQIKNSPKPGKDKLSWQWNKGAAFSTFEVGTPDAGTAYTLCVYDGNSATSSLKASIDIPSSATLWKYKEPTEQYKDRTGASEGVLNAQFRIGDMGKTRARVGAGGANLVLPSPAGATFFSQSPNVVVQLLSNTGICWTSQFAPEDTKVNRSTLFRAITK